MGASPTDWLMLAVPTSAAGSVEPYHQREGDGGRGQVASDREAGRAAEPAYQGAEGP